MTSKYTDLKSVLTRIQDTVAYLGIELETVDQRSIFGDTPLGIAIGWDDIYAIRILLDNGADINARQEDDFTPLHTAARCAGAAVARLLVERGAHLNAKDGMFNETPLEMALSSKNDAVAAVLAKAGMKGSE